MSAREFITLFTFMIIGGFLAGILLALTGLEGTYRDMYMFIAGSMITFAWYEYLKVTGESSK